MRFYKLAPEQIAKELNSDINNGMSAQQCELNRIEFGSNIQFKFNKTTNPTLNPLFIFLSVCVSIIFAVSALLLKDINYLYYGLTYLAIFLIFQTGLYIFNFVIDLKLKKQTINTCAYYEVLRDGTKQFIKAVDIVPGDIVYLKQGDYIPFDAVIVESNGFVTDESEIGGEDTVQKRFAIISEDNVNADKLFNTVFCGSFVKAGCAKVIITDIGHQVYVEKTNVKRKNNRKIPSKIVDISKIFTSIFLLFCFIFSIISGLIAKSPVLTVSSAVMIISLLFSSIIRSLSQLTYKKIFINLLKSGILLKNLNVINQLNNVDTLFIDYKHLVENNAQITGFIDTNGDYNRTKDVLNNFDVFMFAALCLNQNSIIHRLCVDALKKSSADYEQVSALCPVIKANTASQNDISLTVRAYQGSNTIIAVGDYNTLKNYCTNEIKEESIGRLNFNSTELMAVAIKNVDAIPDEISVKDKNFTLVGVIGINKRVSQKAKNGIKLLNNSGVHTTLLFSGNISSATALSKNDFNFKNIVSLNDIEKADLTAVDLICDYNDDIDALLAKLDSKSCVSVFGDKPKQSNKILNFKCNTSSSYELKDSDVVVENPDNVFETFYQTKKANYILNLLFEKSTTLYAFYVIIGVLYSLLNNEFMLSPIMFGLVYLVCIPLIILLRLLSKTSYDKITLKNSTDYPLNNKTVTSVIISAAIFIVLCTVCKFIFATTSYSLFLTLAFITYLSVDFDNISKFEFSNLLAVILPIMLAVVLCSSAAKVFFVAPMSALVLFLAVVLGIALKVAFYFISRLVKN